MLGARVDYGGETCVPGAGADKEPECSCRKGARCIACIDRDGLNQATPMEAISGLELRLLADRADAAGQKQLAVQLHELARQREREELECR